LKFFSSCATGAALIVGISFTTVFVEPSVAQDAENIVDEIIVTSRYRAEKLSDVPDSITPFTIEEIDRYRIERINRVASLTPNLRFSDDQEVGVSTLVIRGIRQNRGTGVLIATRKPTATPELRLRFTAAEGQDYTLAGTASGPLAGDSVLGRLSFRVQDREGQLRNAYLDNQYVDYKESSAFRGKLLFTPNEKLTIDLRAHYLDQDGGSGYFMPGSDFYLPLPPPNPPIIVDVPEYEIQSNKIGESFVKSSELSAKIDYELGWATLTSITSFTDVDSGNDQDLDQTFVEAIDIVVIDNSETIAQELRLVSDDDRQLRWVAGISYFSQERFRSLATTFLGTPVPPAAQDLELEDLAVFGSLSYDISDSVELTLAFRWDEETPKDITQGRSNTFRELQPKVSLAYNIREGLLGYVTVGKGFRAGGFNNLAPGSNFEPGFDKESLISYEAGLKASAYGGRLRAGMSLFFIDYTDQQYFLFDQTGTQANINVPKSEIAGGELELSAQATDSLLLNFGIGFTDSEIVEYVDIPGVLVPASEIIGKNVPGAPVLSVNLAMQHTAALNDSLDLVSRIDFEHRGKTYWTLDNVDTQEAYNLTNLSIALEKERWSTRLYVNNVFDEEYIEWFFGARFIGLPADIAWPSKPRQAGIEFSLSY
jgi:iron complex outermembrane receptor protein